MSLTKIKEIGKHNDNEMMQNLQYNKTGSGKFQNQIWISDSNKNNNKKNNFN